MSDKIIIAELKHSGRVHIIDWQENYYYWLPSKAKAECGVIGWFNAGRNISVNQAILSIFLCESCLNEWRRKRVQSSEISP